MDCRLNMIIIPKSYDSTTIKYRLYTYSWDTNKSIDTLAGLTDEAVE